MSSFERKTKAALTIDSKAMSMSNRKGKGDEVSERVSSYFLSPIPPFPTLSSWKNTLVVW